MFDEVFTGLYRLGRFSSASFLRTQPDISCHAKLLTGGLVPLCATLASDSIYKAFLGPEKRDALLHGHSYTAHAVGCHVANTSLQALLALNQSEAWQVCRDDWYPPGQETGPDNTENPAWSMWSKTFVHEISRSAEVESVISLGSVLAITLHDEQTGYSSSAATGLQRDMLGGAQFGVHSRVLGNVFYLMASQTSKSSTLREMERLLCKALC